MNPPEIVKASESALVAIEQAVERFARKHKFQVGAELRADARTVAKLARKAWRNAGSASIGALSDAIDDLKLSLNVALRVGALTFAQFEPLARDTNSLGRRCGGWLKRHSKGQSRPATPPAGRAPTLSARTTPDGVKP